MRFELGFACSAVALTLLGQGCLGGRNEGSSADAASDAGVASAGQSDGDAPRPRDDEAPAKSKPSASRDAGGSAELDAGSGVGDASVRPGPSDTPVDNPPVVDDADPEVDAGDDVGPTPNPRPIDPLPTLMSNPAPSPSEVDAGSVEVEAIYASCRALLEAEPDLGDGVYLIQPASSEPFEVYCDMSTDGGGWTLIFNQDTSFDPTAEGGADLDCHAANCTSLAYSTVPVEADILFHAGAEDIVGDNWLAQVIVRGIHSASRGRTLHDLMTAPGRFYLEAEDNSNLEVVVNAGGEPCDVLQRGFRTLVCEAPVFTFADTNDNTACTEQQSVGHKFALGGETSYSERWYNCAGWPQHAVNQGVAEMPSNFRFWVR